MKWGLSIADMKRYQPEHVCDDTKSSPRHPHEIQIEHNEIEP